MPMIVREPRRATSGVSIREVRKPIPSVCHGYRRLSAVKLSACTIATAAALLLMQPRLAALIETLTERDIAQALNVANGSEEARSLFHARYTIAIADAAVEHLEAVTEFRRYVLAAEEQAKAGNWMMARGGFDPKGRTLRDVLRPFSGQVSIRARLRFHPQNNYVTLPAFDILLGEPTLLAIDAKRTPHVTTAPAGERGTRDLITGATVEVFYNAPTIAGRALPVRLVLEGKELARAAVDFGRLD